VLFIMLKEMRIAGFGGQGVILSAHIIGRAVALHEDNYATMTQNYGPEARGGAASAALVISDSPVLFPYVTHLDILVVMAQEAYTKFTPDLKEDGILIVEEDLVRLDHNAQHSRVYGVPATRFAEELGKKMVQNVVMVGAVCAITKAFSYEACRKAVADSAEPVCAGEGLPLWRGTAFQGRGAGRTQRDGGRHRIRAVTNR
jgi:2-oxoglutarate ferredoxin oxidoreductase subunit gamma